jgi:hypothetical protein
VGESARLSGGVDLGRESVAQRVEARRRGGAKTGRQLIEEAATILGRANEYADRWRRTRPGALRDRYDKLSEEALVTAAVKIRIAQATPLERSWAEHLDHAKVQTIKNEVAAAMGYDQGALALDTQRRVREQRIRVRTEGVPA